MKYDKKGTIEKKEWCFGEEMQARVDLCSGLTDARVIQRPSVLSTCGGPKQSTPFAE